MCVKANQMWAITMDVVSEMICFAIFDMAAINSYNQN